LLERATLPRYKTCGGGLIGTSLASVPPGMRPAVRSRVTEIGFSHLGRAGRLRRGSSAVLRMISREEFDAALVDVATAAGAELRTGTLVRDVVQGGDGPVRLVTSAGEVLARAVVGADGSASRIGNHVGVRCDQVDLGLELELAAGDQQRAWPNRVHLDWGPIPGSYAWVFPKGDSLTVGVIAARGNAEATRAYLDAFVRQMGLQRLPVLRSSGHLTRCRAESSPLARGRVLVAGDAAGLLEPWTREGISYALRSGRLAGTAAAGLAAGSVDAAAGYERAVRDTLGREMAAGTKLLALFARHPRLVHAVMAGNPLGWAVFVRVSSGRTDLARLLRHRWLAAAIALLSR
jgi:geranylgeranyl reductase family protein